MAISIFFTHLQIIFIYLLENEHLKKGGAGYETVEKKALNQKQRRMEIATIVRTSLSGYNCTSTEKHTHIINGCEDGDRAATGRREQCKN